MLSNPYTVIGGRRFNGAKSTAFSEVASFLHEEDARKFINNLADSGDWRGFQDLSVWFEERAFYVLELGLTHFNGPVEAP